MNDKVKERRAKKIAFRIAKIRKVPRQEWLTMDIADEYRNRAKHLSQNDVLDVEQRRELRMELQERCGILEIEAINILQGYHIQSYVQRYKMAATRMPFKSELEKVEGDIELVREYIRAIEAGELKEEWLGKDPENPENEGEEQE